MNNDLAPLCEAGLAIVPIPPIDGKPTKAPRAKGWNLPRAADNPNGYSTNIDHFLSCSDDLNFGVHHGGSNTLALDLDDLELTRKLFDDLGIPLTDWLESDQRFEIKSPKPNRGKLLFRLPTDFKAPGVKQAKKPKFGKPKQYDVIFELRCGNGAQDVIMGEHPDFPGEKYHFVGNPAMIPEAPPVLLDMLMHWDAWKPCIDSAFGLEQEPPRISPQRPQQTATIPGARDPVKEFNQSRGCEEVLIDAGYTPAGRDRFIRPGSESNAPGAVIMRNCKDGIERIFSHGGDVLNDKFAHDAFDCFRLLDCGGDWGKALSWNPEITKHNQRLYRQEQDKNAPESPLRDRYNQGDEALKKKPLFPFISASELTAKPVIIDWLIKHIIERGSLNLLFGEPCAGKSLFALEWAFCIAAGIEWNGHRTKVMEVIIIAGEGYSGLSKRLKALELKYAIPAPPSLHISKLPAKLSDSTNAQWVAESIAAICTNPGLVIVDTLHRNMEGDENSSQDIGKVISNVDNYIKPLGAAVLIVHHSGHGDKQRSRGSSSIRAAMDGEFSATKSEDNIVLRCHKAKDFEPFEPMQFRLKPTDLDWLDEDGFPLNSVYLEYDGIAKNDTKKLTLTAREESILASLGVAITARGVQATDEIKAKYANVAEQVERIVQIEHWREQVYRTIESKDTPDAKRQAFNRGKEKLLELGLIGISGNYVWRIFG